MKNSLKELKRETQTVFSEKIQSPNDHTHIHESQPKIGIVHVKNRKGEICSIQTVNHQKDSYKVIYNGRVTIVILSDGSKGVSKCNPLDKWDIQTGHDIAWHRAMINQYKKHIDNLCKSTN